MHIPHRIAAVLAALAIATTAVATGTTPALAAVARTVEQGQTVSLVQPFVGAESATVDPVTAGTLRVGPTDPLFRAELFFTASTSYIGRATITVDPGNPLVIATVDVVGPRADVGASFTPRPAPGPCIQIVSGATVAFGDVTVGAPTTATTQTVVSNCSAGLDVSVFGSISPATSGSGSSAVTWEPVVAVPGPNQFGYRLADSGDGISALLDNDSTVFVRTLPNGFTRSMDHQLSIGSGSTTGINSAFNATITLLATVA